jgi:hypothetical protein
MKVSKYEYLFVTYLWPLGVFKAKVRPLGIKYTIGIVIVYIALHLLGSNVDPIFTWIARALIIFVVIGWIYDWCQKRVIEKYRH